jgi:hypothetical protein
MMKKIAVAMKKIEFVKMVIKIMDFQIFMVDVFFYKGKVLFFMRNGSFYKTVWIEDYLPEVIVEVDYLKRCGIL